MKKYIAILMTAILMTGCAADVETSTPATESTENTTVITTTTVEVEENTPTDTDTEDNNSDTEAEDNNSTPATTETEDTSSTTTTEAETEDNTSTPVDTTVTTTVTEEKPVDTEDTTPTDNEGTVTEETPVEVKPVVTTTTAATTKPVTEDKPVEEKPAVTTKPTTTTTDKKTETKPTIKSELHPEIENINLPKMNDLLNYNVKPISEISAKELGLVTDGGGVMYPNFENLTDSYLLTDSPLCSHKNLDAYMNEKLVVGTDIPEGLYYVTYNSYTGQQSTYFKHTNKNGKEQDKIYLYAPNYREIYGFDEWNFYIYASKGDVITGSGLALLPAPNFNCTENFIDSRFRNYYVSEKNGGIKPGTYTIKVDKEGIEDTSYTSFWKGRGMYGVYTMDKNGDFVSITTETYMQNGYEMDGILVDSPVTITLEEGQLIELSDLDIEFVS